MIPILLSLLSSLPWLFILRRTRRAAAATARAAALVEGWDAGHETGFDAGFALALTMAAHRATA